MNMFDVKIPTMPSFGDLVPDLVPDLKKTEVKRDRYGFVVQQDEGLDLGFSAFGSMVGGLGGEEKETIAKWRALLQPEGPLERTPELLALVRAGVPHELRAEVWFRLSGASARKAAAPADYYDAQLRSYREQRKRGRRKTLADIDKDVDRTFPECVHFEGSEGQDRLRQVLGPFAVRNRAVGYCQSMNYLAGVCMLAGQEPPEAFWSVSVLLEDVMPCYWRRDLLPLQVDQRVFAVLLQEVLPEIWSQLTGLGVSLEALTTQWFLCLFVNTLSMDAALRVWDLLFCHGGHLIFQVALALLSLNQELILAKESLDQFIEGVKELAATVEDIDKLLEEAFGMLVLGPKQSSEEFRQRVDALREQHRGAVQQEAAALQLRRENSGRRLAQRPGLRGLAAQSQASKELRRSLGEISLIQRNLAREHPRAEGEVLEVLRPALGLQQAHVVLVGLRGAGKHLAMMLAQAGVGRLSLVDCRRTTGADVDRVCVLNEHHSKLATVHCMLAEALKETIEAAYPATVVEPLAVAVAASEAGKEKLRKALGELPEVHCIVCCADTAAMLLGTSKVCSSRGEPWVSVSVSTDARKGSVATVLPGLSPCAECAQPMPAFMVPAATAAHTPVGNALKLVVSLATQHVVTGLLTGRFENTYHCIDAEYEERVVSRTHPLCDPQCSNAQCAARREGEVAPGVDIDAEKDMVDLLAEKNQDLCFLQESLLTVPRKERRGLREKAEALEAEIKELSGGLRTFRSPREELFELSPQMVAAVKIQAIVRGNAGRERAMQKRLEL